MRRFSFLYLLCLTIFVGCQSQPRIIDGAKIHLDLAAIDENGLIGPADGKRSQAYEFCIPNTGAHRREVQAIAPGLQIHPGSQGRVGCTDKQALCIGDTGQPSWRSVLTRLAALDYITEIRPCYFE